LKPRNHSLLQRSNTVIVVVDLQEPFLRKIYQREQLLARCQFLLEAAVVLDIPVIFTLQYAERMGGLVPEISELMPRSCEPPIDKLCFSAAANHQFTEKLEALNREQILLCGVETHICVSQTALDLLHLDYQIHCAADAVSSRSLELHKLGMEKMRDCGIIPCAAEGAVMEMLYEAGTPEFKSILKLIR
jgi:nicotinamidase-related amidase